MRQRSVSEAELQWHEQEARQQAWLLAKRLFQDEIHGVLSNRSLKVDVSKMFSEGLLQSQVARSSGRRRCGRRKGRWR